MGFAPDLYDIYLSIYLSSYLSIYLYAPSISNPCFFGFTSYFPILPVFPYVTCPMPGAPAAEAPQCHGVAPLRLCSRARVQGEVEMVEADGTGMDI